MSFNLRPGTSLFGNITFTPGTNENYVAPPVHQGPPPMTVGWSNAGLSESERVAPAANGMQLYRDSQPYTNEHPNRTLHNLPEYLEGLPFTVESSSVNSVMGTTNSFEEYTFNTSGTLYLILRSDWGGFNPSTLELVSASLGDTTPSGVLDPSAWTSVEDNVGYMGGGGPYGTYVFSRSVEAGTHSLNNIYYYAFKADAPAPAAAPSASWIVVGAYAKSNDHGYDGGAAYVFDANDLSAQPTKLIPFDGTETTRFGSNTAATSDKIFIRSRSEASVYVYDANNLAYQPTKIDIETGISSNTTSYSLYVMGDKLIASSFKTCEVRVYNINDLSAAPTILQTPSTNQEDRFGWAVAASNEKLVVTAQRDNHNGILKTGAAYVYDINDLTSEPTKLTAFDAASHDQLGNSVAISADKIVVGAPSDDDAGSASGSVYVFDVNDLTAQPTKLTAFDEAQGDGFGGSVAVNSDKIVVGASGDDDNGSSSGSVYVYDANDLSAQPTKLVSNQSDSYFGIEVAVSYDTLVVSAAIASDRTGEVYVYDMNDLSAQPTKLTAFDGQPEDRFGQGISIG